MPKLSKPRPKKDKAVRDVIAEPKVDKTVKVYQRGNLKIKLNLAKPTWTPKQNELINIITDKETKIVFVKGPSGSSKTYLAMAMALEKLNSGRIKEIVLVRSIVESSPLSLGALPGDADEKLSPFMAPFEEKMRELLPKEQITALKADGRFVVVPANHLRGRQFDASFIICDEAQNMMTEELQTLLTRIGKYSKLIVCGDTEQTDFIRGKKLDSGFRPFYDWYIGKKAEAEKHGIFCFKFGIEDILRDDVVKYIVEQYDALRVNHRLVTENKLTPITRTIDLPVAEATGEDYTPGQSHERTLRSSA